MVRWCLRSDARASRVIALWRGSLRTNKAPTSFVCSSQVSSENLCRAIPVVCLMEAKWIFVSDHHGLSCFGQQGNLTARSFEPQRGAPQSMSSPQNRRADRAMSDERALQTLAQGYSGHLATVSDDGFPYCIPLLYA